MRLSAHGEPARIGKARFVVCLFSGTYKRFFCNFFSRAYIAYLISGALFFISSHLFAQQPVVMEWPLTGMHQVAKPNAFSSLGFNTGKSVDSLQFTEEFGATTTGWNTDNPDPEAYYEYTITPAPGRSIEITRLNFEVSLSRVNMRTSVQYSYDGFRQQKVQIGHTIYVGTPMPRNLPVKTSLRVTYPQTLTIRVFGWSTVDHRVSFHNRNVVFEGMLFGNELIAQTETDKMDVSPESLVVEPLAENILNELPRTDAAIAAEPLVAMSVMPQPEVIYTPKAGEKGVLASQTYTSSSTWTCPPGVTQITVECWGGGGAGGGATGNPAAGGGGAGGSYAKSNLTVIPGTVYTVTVAGIRTATTNSTAAQNKGFPSWFRNVSTIYAEGGNGGAPASSNSSNGAAGAGSTALSIGDLLYSGGNASSGNYVSGTPGGAGGGGAGTSGNGGNANSGIGGSGTGLNGGNGANGVSNNTAGATGFIYGGGGSGGKANGNTDRAGGAGNAGLVVITWVPAYQAEFISMDFGSSVWCAGETRTVSVTVMNSGQATWTDAPSPLFDINIGVKWNTNGASWADYYVRTNANNLAPGETATYSLTITASNFIDGTGYTTPLATGINNLTFDVVKEADCWFGNNNGSCGPGNSVFTSPNLTIVSTTPAQPSVIAGTASPCSGSSLTYSVTNVIGTTYTWIVPAGWNITAGQGSNTITVTAGATGGNITVTPSNSCGTGTARTLAVTTSTVPAQPSAITGNTAPCAGSSQVYSVTNVSGVTYNWTFPAGWTQTAGGNTNSVSAMVGANSGTINVTPSNTCGNGSASSLPVTVIALPIATISGPSLVCEGSSGNVYTTEPGMTNYTWAITGGNINSGAGTNSVSVTWTASGNQQISVYYTDMNGCTGEPTIYPVTVNTAATVAAGTDQSVCSSSPATTLAGTVGGGASSGSWSGGAGTYNPNANTLNAVYTPSAAEIASGTVTLTLTSNDPAGPCGPVSDQMVITIHQAATVNAGADQSICAYTPIGSVSLNGSIGGSASSATWSSSGSGNFNPNASTLNATYQPSAADVTLGSVILTLTTNDPAGVCSAASDAMTLTINPLPLANAGPDRQIYRGSSTTIGSGPMTGNTYTWTAIPADPTLNSSQAQPNVSPLVNTTYTLIVTNTSTGCTNTDEVIVTVTDNLTISKSLTIAPARPGDPMQYVITYANNNQGGVPALNVEIVDYLPDVTHFTYSGASLTPSAIGAGMLRWNSSTIPQLASLPVGTYTITINGNCGSPGSISWPTYHQPSFYIMSGGGSQTLSNNASVSNVTTTTPIYIQDIVRTEVNQFCQPSLQPDEVVGYIKSATPSSIFYVFTITNNGNITDRFVFSFNNNVNPTTENLAFSTVTLAGDPLPVSDWLLPGESMTFLVRVECLAGTQPNKVNTSWLIATSFVCGNSDQSLITTYTYGGNIPGNACDLQVIKTVSANPMVVGNLYSYTVTVSNSVNPASDVSVQDLLPANVEHISHSYSTSVSGASVDLAYNNVTHTVTGIYRNDNQGNKDRLNSGEFFSINIVVRPLCSAVPSVLNYAKVGTSTPEVNDLNNETSLTTNVISNLPQPVITPAAPVICSGQTAILTASGAPANHGYRWYDNGGNLVFTGNPFTTPHLTSSITYYATVYEIANPDCESARTAVTITVYTVPEVTLQPVDVTVCEGGTATFAIVATALPAGNLSYQWQVDEGGGFVNLTNTAIYSGVTSQTLTITGVLYSMNGYSYRCMVQNGTCGYLTISNAALLTVYPQPEPVINGPGYACQGSTGNIYTTEAGMSNYIWNISGGNITSGAGTNTIAVTWTTPGSQWVSVTYTDPNGCSPDSPVVYPVTVNPTPFMQDPSDQEVCNGQQTNPVVFSGTNVTSYHWTNNNISIGLPASGTGNIAAFTGINTGITTQTATITVTPRHTANGFSCDGIPQIFTITVFPTPAATATPPSESICSGGTTNITLNSLVSGTTFTWTAVLQSGSNTTFNASGSGNLITELIVNNSNAPATVRYIITPSASGCSGTQLIVDVVVYPSVNVTSNPLSPVTICSRESTNISLISNVAGTVFNWTASLVSGIATGFSDGSGNLIDQILVNNSGVDAVVLYKVTGTANSCPSGTYDIYVTIQPAPAVSSQTTTAVCSDVAIGVLLNGSNNGVIIQNYEVISINSNGLTASEGPASGTIGVNGLAGDAWTNNSGVTVNVVYTIVPVSTAGCDGDAFTVTVPILPAPLGNNQSTAICSRIALNHSLTSQIAPPNAGVTFMYSVTSSDQVNVPAGPDRTVPSAANITDTYVNLTGVPVTITYEVIPIGSNGCRGSIFLFEAIINPEPVGSSNPPSPLEICEGAWTNIELLSNVTGTSFSWTATTLTGVVWGYSSGNGTTINQQLWGLGTMRYTITPVSPAGCVGQTFTIDVTVNLSLVITMNVTGSPAPLPSDATVCPGQPISLNLSSANTFFYLTRFNWQNDNPSIGLPANGGPVPFPGNGSFLGNVSYLLSFTATNSTNIPQTAHLTITADAYTRRWVGGIFTGHWEPNEYQCTADVENITITVNPTPTVNPVNNQIVCSGEEYTPEPFETTVPGTTFSWSYTGPNIGLTPTSGTGNIPTFTAVNTGATNLVANFTVTPYYSGGGVTCSGTPRNFTITVRPSPASPTITGTTTICYGAQATLIASSATSGVIFRWYDAPGGNLLFTGNPFVTPGLTTSTTYYVVSYSGTSLCESQPIAVTVTVQSEVDPGHIGEDQTVCYGGDPEPFYGDPATGDGAITYQWQSATGPAWTFGNITGATGEIYDVPAGLTLTTRYRRLAYSTLNGVLCASPPSNELTITVQQQITPGVIAADQTVCPGGNPALLTSVAPAGGGIGNPSYRWQSSTDGLNFTNITPPETGLTYDPPAGITQSTWYRRLAYYELNGVFCEAPNPSNSIKITVDDITNPQITACPVERIIDGCGASSISNPAFSSTRTASTYIEFSGAPNYGSAVDNCGSITEVYYQDEATGSCPTIVTRTWEVVDHFNNSAFCEQTIAVDDNTNPAITGTIPTTPVAGCSASDIPAAVNTVAALEALGLTISDNCTPDASLVVTHSDGAPSGTCPISIIRTYTITDACLNSTQTTQTFDIDDNINPEIFCPVTGTQTVVVNTGDTYTHNAPPNWDATATDNCPGTVTLEAQLSGVTTTGPYTSLNGVSFNQGLTTVTWIATDACGNTATCSFDVQVDGEADISVVKTVSPVGAITAGQNITYTLVVTNNGPAVAPEVTLLDNMPIQVIDPTTWTLNGIPQAGAWPEAYVFTNMAVGASGQQTIVITGKVSCNISNMFANTATVLLSPPFIDPNTGNNNSTVTNSIVDPVTVSGITTDGDCESNGEIDITVTGGTPPYTYTWTTLDGVIPAGQENNEDLTGLVSGTYTLVVTDANGCEDTDSWTVTSEDTEPPTFTAPGPFDYCVIDIFSALYDGQPEPDADIIPEAIYQPQFPAGYTRPDWYIVAAGSTELDLLNLADNCCDPEDLEISWTITFSNGHPSITGSGQPSTFDPDNNGTPDPIKLWGTPNYVEVTHTITYIVTDCNGVSAPTVVRNILIRPRPEVIKQ